MGTVSIYETVQQVAYNEDINNDGNLDKKRAYIQRYAKCGTDGLTSFSFSELKGFTPLTELSMPIGLISMWSGATIPEDWALCDGTNNTPNLKDRFIVGAGNDYNIGALGGTKKVTLAKSLHIIILEALILLEAINILGILMLAEIINIILLPTMILVVMELLLV